MEIPRRYKIKEHHLRDALKEEFSSIKMVFDKPVDGGCSRKRPDILIDCLTHSVVIECDEDEHKGYSCENKRTMELFNDLGSRPLVMIRFNPDSYSADGEKVQGCFKTTKTGSLSLNKREWKKRIKKLIKTINEYITDVPVKEINVVQLFYSK